MTDNNVDYGNIYNEQGYVHLRQFVPDLMTNYLREYFNTLDKTNSLEPGDAQVENSNCVYGDPAFDTFMLMATPIISKIIGLDLLPTYTYARIYHRGAELLPHVDREQCEHSCTISLGGEYEKLWPIWVKHPEKHPNPLMIDLYPGDILIYKGTEILHWRDEFLGLRQYQLFMHFVDAHGKFSDQLYDTRPYIGMKSSSKK